MAEEAEEVLRICALFALVACDTFELLIDMAAQGKKALG